MPPLPLTNLEIRKYYQKEAKFNGVYSRNNLPKIKDGAYVINLDKYKSIGTHWVAFYIFVEHIPKEIQKFIRNKNIITSVYRIQA